MTLDQALDWGVRIVMGIASVFVFLLGRDRKQVEAALDGKLALRDERLKDLEWRFNAAGKETSDLASIVQALVGVEARLMLVIAQAERAAKHDAVQASAATIADVALRKMDEKLCTSQLDELRRRLTALERAS